MADAPGRFWVVRYKGTPVMRWDTAGQTPLPTEVEAALAIDGDVSVATIADRAALAATALDYTALADAMHVANALGIPEEYVDGSFTG